MCSQLYQHELSTSAEAFAYKLGHDTYRKQSLANVDVVILLLLLADRKPSFSNAESLQSTQLLNHIMNSAIMIMIRVL